MSWKCSCGIINSGLNKQCADQTTNRFSSIHNQTTINKPDLVMLAVAIKGLYHMSDMTEAEKLYAKFFSEHTVFVSDMDRVTLENHIRELSEIAFEAKAKLSAATNRRREMNAGVKNKEWLITNNEPDQTVTDSISTVQTRAKRLSKLDKIRENLLKTGISEDIVREMMANMSARATNQTLNYVEKDMSKIKEIDLPDDDPFAGSK